MTSSTRFRSPILVGRDAAGPHSVMISAYSAADPSSATAITTGVTLPKGAILHQIRVNAIGTGGTNPTIGVGDSTNNDGYIDVLPADGGTAVPIIYPGLATYAGADFVSTPLTADTEMFIIGGDTGTDATAGVVHLLFEYSMVVTSSIDASGE